MLCFNLVHHPESLLSEGALQNLAMLMLRKNNEKEIINAVRNFKNINTAGVDGIIEKHVKM